jgi:succinate dehydrogenase / fumarate reductase flavoprotein subunit
MKRALECLTKLRDRSRNAGIGGHREYNPGWHAALDLPNLLTVSEAITQSAIERRESRGGHFREDYPDKDAAFATFNIITRKASDGGMEVARAPIPPMPDELKKIIEDMK